MSVIPHSHYQDKWKHTCQHPQEDRGVLVHGCSGFVWIGWKELGKWTAESHCLYNFRVPPFHPYAIYSFETSYYSWEIVTLKVYLYEEGNNLLRRFCFAKDLCILPVSSEVLTTSIHLMEQTLNQREGCSPFGQKFGGVGHVAGRQWWWETFSPAVLRCIKESKKDNLLNDRLIKESMV